MRLSRRAGPLALALALSATACHRTPAAIHVASVRVSVDPASDELGEVGLEAVSIEAGARDALAKAGFPIGEGKRTYRGNVRVLSLRMMPAPDGKALVAEVALEVELSPVESAPENLSYVEPGTGTAPFERDRAAEAWARALHVALAEASAALAKADAQGRKGGGGLVADLESTDPSVRERAVSALGEQRSAAAVPALIRRLNDPEPRVVQRAIGALAQIRDPRAVGPLIDLSAGQDPAFVARLVRIVGDIGGDEARGFLLTLQAGHPDARVQSAAREALRDLEAREEEAARVATGR